MSQYVETLTRAQLRTPKAAATAGIVFSVLYPIRVESDLFKRADLATVSSEPGDGSLPSR